MQDVYQATCRNTYEGYPSVTPTGIIPYNTCFDLYILYMLLYIRVSALGRLGFGLCSSFFARSMGNPKSQNCKDPRVFRTISANPNQSLRQIRSKYGPYWIIRVSGPNYVSSRCFINSQVGLFSTGVYLELAVHLSRWAFSL